MLTLLQNGEEEAVLSEFDDFGIRSASYCPDPVFPPSAEVGLGDWAGMEGKKACTIGYILHAKPGCCQRAMKRVYLRC